MSENDGWRYQGRQEHGWFGNGTKPTDAAAKPGSMRAGLPASVRGGAGGGRSWRWPGSRLATERRSQPVSPLPFAPLLLPNPYMGAEAAARARRRWSHVAAEFARGDYGSVAAHLLLGKAFPAEADDPEPEKLPPNAGEAATSPQGDPGGGKPGELIGSLLDLTEAERRWAEARVKEGHKVEVIFNDPKTPTADFVVDGIPIELKSLNPSGKTDPERLSARISSRLVMSPRQSSNIAVDATEVPQVAKEIALEGIARGLGAAEAKGKTISTITIYTRYGEVTWPK